MRSIAIVTLAAAAAGCQKPGPALDLRLQEGASAGHIENALAVVVRSHDDAKFGGPGALAFVVEITNVSDQPLSDCELWLGEARASFGAIGVYRGFLAGDVPRGRSDLRKGEAVSFAFNHDNSNYGVMRGGDGTGLPSTMIPKTVTISCGEKRVSWRLGA